MYQIILGEEPKQQITWQTEDNKEVILYFEYKDNQLGWYFGLRYDDIDYKNIRLTTHANILRSYFNYLNFGMMVNTEDGLEPMSIDDFAEEYCQIFMLTKEECLLVEGEIYAKVSA